MFSRPPLLVVRVTREDWDQMIRSTIVLLKCFSFFLVRTGYLTCVDSVYHVYYQRIWEEGLPLGSYELLSGSWRFVTFIRVTCRIYPFLLSIDYKSFTFLWKPFVLSAKGAFPSNLISDKLDKKSNKIVMIWGRREDYMKLVKERLGLWIDDPSSLSLNDIYLTHILATVPSQSMRMRTLGVVCRL
jgi:hypothetical protein